MKPVDFNFNDTSMVYPMWHTLKAEKMGGYLLTGCDPQQEISCGISFRVNNQIFRVEEIIERRDHAGRFEKQEDKNNSYFKARCLMERDLTVQQ